MVDGQSVSRLSLLSSESFSPCLAGVNPFSDETRRLQPGGVAGIITKETSLKNARKEEHTMWRSVVVILCGTLLLMAEAFTATGKDKVPVSMGGFEVYYGGERIGEEQFRLFRDKKLVVESTATVYWPEAVRYEYQYELGDSHQIEKLEGTMTRGGLVTEFELKRHRENWRIEIKGKGRKKMRQDLGSRASTEIDFGSLLFNGLIVKHLGLHPRENRQINTVVWQLPDFVCKRTKQTYRRLEDEDIEVKAFGTVHASVYELVSEQSSHQIWFNSSGVAVRARFDLPAGRFEHELVRFNTRPDVW
jgi:hypothetical protein